MEALARCGLDPTEIRRPEQLEGIEALVMPGGESTTMIKLLTAFDLVDPLAKRLADGMPVLGTCAGMILLASRVLDGHPDQLCFGAIDLEVRRNGYGRQVDSFEADLDVPLLGPPPVRAVFIRAPVVDRVGPGVEVLAQVDSSPVLCRQGPILVTSFHPELSGDDRLHRLFVDGLAS
jgi:5'-phosphate synthase pdxT subunit